MYKLKVGWTKARVMEQVKKYNNGKRSVKRTASDKEVSPTSFVINELCAYQTVDGNRCAIGCFIPDGHAGLSFDGGVLSLLYNYPDLIEHMPFDIPKFPLDTAIDQKNGALWVFQKVHDSLDDVSNNNVHVAIENWLNENVEDA